MPNWRAILVIVAVVAVTVAGAQETGGLAPNASFEQGEGDRPAGWRLEGAGEWAKAGAHTGNRCVAVDGDGRGSVYWRCDDIPWKPSQLYQFSFWSRAEAGAVGGCIISGPSFANDDYGRTNEWTRTRFVFVCPPSIPPEPYLRVGVWATEGRVYFDDVALLPTIPIHRRFGDIELGDGEAINGTSYTFSHNLNGYANNYCRPLADFNAGYNSNRWVFGPGAYVVYRHEVPGARIKEARVTVNVNYHVSGTCVVEASRDGQSWEQLGLIGEVAGGEFSVPAALLPSDRLLVRLRSPGEQEGRREDSAPGAFQVNAYSFSAVLDKDMGEEMGSTTYVTVEKETPGLLVAVGDLGGGAGQNTAELFLTNKNTQAVAARVEVALVPEREGEEETFGADTTVLPGKTEGVRIPWHATRVGTYEVRVRVTEGPRVLFAASAGTVIVPHVRDASYGYLISADETGELWWCEGSWKVGRERAAPTQKNPELYVEAARGEFESVQLVLRPRRDMQKVTVTVSGLKGEGATLPASSVSARQVAYVYVKHPTDSFGAEGWWPDPLPPIKGPVDAPAGQNLPILLTVHVPRTARPGVYRGTVSLAAQGGWTAQVPVRVRVFSFAIAEEVHVQTALGLSAGEIWRYHNLTEPGDAPLREQVWDLYMQDWRDHHIAPYHFWTKDFEVRITGFDWSGGEPDNTTAHGGRQSLKIIDDSPTGNPAATMNGTIQLERGKSYVLRFWAKTASEGQEFMVTLGQNDAAGKWIWGNNIDLVWHGSTEWKQYERTLEPAAFHADAHSVSFTLRPTRWRADGETTGTTWFDDVYLGLAPDGPNLLADPGFEKTPDGVKVTIDWTGWDEQAEKYLDGYKFTTFCLPVMGLGGGRYPNFDRGRFGPFSFGTPAYERLMGEYLRQLQEHLEARGWLKKAYLYWYDEPEEADYEFVVERMNLINRLAPRLTRMLTEQPEEPLYGAVDLWCPVLSNYKPEALHARQKLGERVWWYVCCGPRAPWLGLFIDHPHTDMRAWLWATWKWQVEGCLIWTTNWWTCGSLFGNEYQNPWEDPMSYTADSKPGAVGYWGNGDGRFLYPPNRKGYQDRETKYVEGPVDSYRWEQLRDGIEDYEYLWMLREAIAKKAGSPAARQAAALLEVPEEIVGENASSFAHRPLPILEHRRRVAEALEKLSR